MPRKDADDRPLAWLHGEIRTPPFSSDTRLQLVEAGCAGTTMKATKRARLENAGWKIGSAAEFLNLSPAESAYIEMKLSLGQALRNARTRKRLSQTELANLLSSSQSRVAKMEAGDASVSIDLLIKSLLAIGTTPRQVATCLASPPQP
jgi:predicted XRE-type DNA-binding protein